MPRLAIGRGHREGRGVGWDACCLYDRVTILVLRDLGPAHGAPLCVCRSPHGNFPGDPHRQPRIGDCMCKEDLIQILWLYSRQ